VLTQQTEETEHSILDGTSTFTVWYIPIKSHFLDPPHPAAQRRSSPMKKRAAVMTILILLLTIACSQPNGITIIKWDITATTTDIKVGTLGGKMKTIAYTDTPDKCQLIWSENDQKIGVISQKGGHCKIDTHSPYIITVPYSLPTNFNIYIEAFHQKCAIASRQTHKSPDNIYFPDQYLILDNGQITATLPADTYHPIALLPSCISVFLYSPDNGAETFVAYDDNGKVVKTDLQLNHIALSQHASFIPPSPTNMPCTFISSNIDLFAVCFYTENGILKDRITYTNGKIYSIVKHGDNISIIKGIEYPYITCDETGCLIYLSKDKYVSVDSTYNIFLPDSPVIRTLMPPHR